MEKETKKKSSAFIIRNHYQNDGMKAKELVEKEMYKRIINDLGQIDQGRTMCYNSSDKRSECGSVEEEEAA